MIILIIATLILIGNWILEYRRHSRKVAAIPIRIHVNGTRENPALLVLSPPDSEPAMWRQSQKNNGHTTQSWLSDGREAAIIRLQGANIIEQKYIFPLCATQIPTQS